MGLIIKQKATQKQLLAKSSASKKFYADQTVLAAILSSPAKVNDLVPQLLVKQVPIEELKSAKRRVRKPSKNHVANIANCIKLVGRDAALRDQGRAR